MTTKHVFSLALGAVCLWGSAPSAAGAFEDDFYPEGVYGWYEAGPALVEDAELRDFFGNPVNGNAVELETGFHFGIGFGQELTRYLSVEIESGFNYNKLKSIAGATASSGNFYRVPVRGNVVLQFPNRTGFVPVIGAGAGGQWLAFDAQNVSLGATTVAESSETWVFGYQGYAGVRYEIGERLSLGLFYRYNVADAPSWTFDSIPAGNLKLDSIRTHSVSLTLGWLF